MRDPAWTEYELLEVISKEHKDSENLPPHFIPDWYFEQRCPYINPEFAYAIEADQKMRLKMTLKPMQPINSEACVVILLLQEHVNGSYWMSICTLLIKAF